MNTENYISDMIRGSIQSSVPKFSPYSIVAGDVSNLIWHIVYESTCDPVWNVVKDWSHHIRHYDQDIK